ncbi:MAG: ribosome recycling factor [Dehalococcoidia bacterium]|nr:ribosome recycling factor [Chloroflexota bacterium]MCZ6867059.1 ribosome recycling factor [Chloroflexota bacterium]
MAASKSDDAPTPEDILKDADRRMSMSIEFLKRELQTVRTGRATPSLVENLTAEYYGTPTPLGQMATISAPDAQLILIQPWDRQSLQEIEKAIIKSPTGLNPSNDGSVIRIPVPPLSQERRQELVKSLGKTVEDGKVAVRNVRRDAQDKLRTLERNKDISQDENQRAQTQLQKTTDTHITEIDQFWKSKVEEMMTV